MAKTEAPKIEVPKIEVPKIEELKAATPGKWLDAVLENFDEFLVDHAANERKASAAAMSLIAHYPDKPEMLEELVDLALEELSHFRQVMKLMLAKGVCQTPDEKDLYVNQLLKKIDKGPDYYLLDRLLTSAVIEARGAERFGLIAEGHPDLETRRFYSSLVKSELGHYQLFLDLAQIYYEPDVIDARWLEWLDAEANIMLNLPIRARLH